MTRLLLDTLVLLWWLADEQVADEASRAIAAPDNQVFVSAASIWEATIKRGLGKLELNGSLAQAADTSGFTLLPVRAEHAEAVAALPGLHHDPFDRMLIAHAIVESLTLVTRDRAIVAYDVQILQA